MAWRDIDIGAVSAYAVAVEQGYQGTEEQWAMDQAQAGANGALAKQSAETAVAAAEAAQKTLESLEPNTQQAIAGIQTEGRIQRDSVTSTGDTQNQRVLNTGAEQSRALDAQGTTERQKVVAAGDEQVARVQQAGIGEVETIVSTGASQVNAISTKGAEAVVAVQTEQATAISAVQTESTAQQTAIENKGQEQLDKIPEVTSLAKDVSKLSEDIDNVGNMVSYGDILNTANENPNPLFDEKYFTGDNSVFGNVTFNKTSAVNEIIMTTTTTPSGFYLTLPETLLGKTVYFKAKIKAISNLQLYDGTTIYFTPRGDGETYKDASATIQALAAQRIYIRLGAAGEARIKELVISTSPDVDFYAFHLSEMKTNPLYGKKLCLIGDSITEKNTYSKTNWGEWISEWSGAIIQNLGIGGTGFAKSDSRYIDRISQIEADVDIIGVACSFNDVGLDMDIGTASDTGDVSIAGYISDFFTALINAFPNTPIICYCQSPWEGRHYPNPRGTEYVEVCAEICANQGIPFYADMYLNGGGLKPWVEANKTLYYTHDGGRTDVDGVHPNSQGHKIIARRLMPKFEENVI